MNLYKKIAIIVISALLPLSAPVWAEYPEQPVTFVVPFPPGDLEDVLTRIIAENFQEEYGVASAVVNKPGGGPFPGAVEVAKAPADGSMIGSFVIGVPVIGPQIGIPELSPDPFEPLGIFLTYPFVIVTKKDAPYQSMEQLASYARNNDVALGHFGAILPPTKVTFALAKSMNFSYASESAFDALNCNTLASGDVDVMNTTIQQILPCLKYLTVLASVTDERIPLIPNTPTVAELNPALKLSLWNGLFVHKDTPQNIRNKIIAVAKKTVMGAKAQKISRQSGALIYWKDADSSKAQITEDIASFKLISEILDK